MSLQGRGKSALCANPVIASGREILNRKDPSVMKTKIVELTGFLLVRAALLLVLTHSAEAVEFDAPRIYVETSASDARVNSPVQVLVHFEAATGSEIDVASFQVLYQFGIFKKDITKQILRFVTLTSTGLTGSAPPELPPGVHTLIIRIRDTQHRLGEQMLSFRIGR